MQAGGLVRLRTAPVADAAGGEPAQAGQVVQLHGLRCKVAVAALGEALGILGDLDLANDAAPPSSSIATSAPASAEGGEEGGGGTSDQPSVVEVGFRDCELEAALPGVAGPVLTLGSGRATVTHRLAPAGMNQCRQYPSAHPRMH